MLHSTGVGIVTQGQRFRITGFDTSAVRCISRHCAGGVAYLSHAYACVVAGAVRAVPPVPAALLTLSPSGS